GLCGTGNDAGHAGFAGDVGLLCERQFCDDSARVWELWNHGPESVSRRGFQESGFLRSQELALWGTAACAVPRGVLQHSQPPQFREPVWRTEWLRSERSRGIELRLWVRYAGHRGGKPRYRFGGATLDPVGPEVHLLVRNAETNFTAGLMVSGLFHGPNCGFTIFRGTARIYEAESIHTAGSTKPDLYKRYGPGTSRAHD